MIPWLCLHKTFELKIPPALPVSGNAAVQFQQLKCQRTWNQQTKEKQNNPTDPKFWEYQGIFGCYFRFLLRDIWYAVRKAQRQYSHMLQYVSNKRHPKATHVIRTLVTFAVERRPNCLPFWFKTMAFGHFTVSRHFHNQMVLRTFKWQRRFHKCIHLSSWFGQRNAISCAQWRASRVFVLGPKTWHVNKICKSYKMICWCDFFRPPPILLWEGTHRKTPKRGRKE